MSALEQAKKLLQDAYYDERGMADAMRKDAATWATIAQAEQLKRIADYMGGYADLYLDPALSKVVNEHNT